MTEKVFTMDQFGLDNDGCGLEFEQFVDALHVFIFTHATIGVKDAATAFNVEETAVRKAVKAAPWLLIGEGDMIEMDGN
jgi:hypothetical protein